MSSTQLPLTQLQEKLKDNTYIYKFLTKLCTDKRCRSPERCFCTHSLVRRRRRVPKQDKHGRFNYIPVHCPQWKKTRKCPLGDTCIRSHGSMEIIFHPLLYKTKMCSSHLKNGVCCQYGIYCAKAHSPTEIRNLVDIYGEDWKRLYDLPMNEKDPESMRIVESERKCFQSQEAIVTLPKVQSYDNNLTGCLLDKQNTVNNLYKDEKQGEGSPLRIPKLASTISTVQSFENHSSYMSSPHLEGIYDSVCYQMPELFLDPVETSYVDLYTETAEMYEGSTDFTIKCQSPVVKVPSECSLHSLPTVSSPHGSSSSFKSNSLFCSPYLDNLEILAMSGSDESYTMDLKNPEWSKENQPQRGHGNNVHSFYE